MNTLKTFAVAFAIAWFVFNQTGASPSAASSSPFARVQSAPPNYLQVASNGNQ